MAQLTFTGRSEDGKRLLLVDEVGQKFTLAIDESLRHALTSTPERNGQLEIPMESSLRPRDIQSRIRAGESPESVSHAAGTSLDRIMAWAAPVLAERAYMAERAQMSSVRRRSGESGARTLGESVTAHLRSENVDPTLVEWDAWRREDGRWTLVGAYEVRDRHGSATFSYDPRGNFVTVDDEEARWLIGEATPATAPAPQPGPDDLSAVRQRRLAAVSTDEVPLGEDAIEMVTDDDAPNASETTMEMGGRTVLERGETELRKAQSSAAARSDNAEPQDRPAPAAESAETTPEPRAAKPAKKRGRSSVPSWDEIMFGGGKSD